MYIHAVTEHESVGQLHSDEICPDRKLAMPPVHEDGELGPRFARYIYGSHH